MPATTTLRNLPSGAWAYTLTSTESGWTLDQPVSPTTGKPMLTQAEAQSTAEAQAFAADPTASQSLIDQLAAAQAEAAALLQQAADAQAVADAIAAQIPPGA